MHRGCASHWCCIISVSKHIVKYVKQQDTVFFHYWFCLEWRGIVSLALWDIFRKAHNSTNFVIFVPFVIELEEESPTSLPYIKKKSPNGCRKKKGPSGWHSLYPVPSGVAHLFRFDWSSGFAKIWWPDESTVFYWSKTCCPRTSLDDVQLVRATIVTISGSWCISMSKSVPNPIPAFK